MLLATPTTSAMVKSSIAAVTAGANAPMVVAGAGLVGVIGGLMTYCTKRTKNGLDAEWDKIVRETDQTIQTKCAANKVPWASKE